MCVWGWGGGGEAARQREASNTVGEEDCFQLLQRGCGDILHTHVCAAMWRARWIAAVRRPPLSPLHAAGRRGLGSGSAPPLPPPPPVPYPPGWVHEPPSRPPTEEEQREAVRLAMLAFAIGTALSVGGSAALVCFVAWSLDVHSLQEFHQKMQQIVPQKAAELGISEKVGRLKQEAVSMASWVDTHMKPAGAAVAGWTRENLSRFQRKQRPAKTDEDAPDDSAQRTG